jgi:hypothetical protein
MNSWVNILSILRRGGMVAAPIPASSPELYAWIGIYPLDLSKAITREFLKNRNIKIANLSSPIYRIRLFEAERTLVDQDVWIAEPHLKNKQDFVIQGEDKLLSKLKELDINIADLWLPYTSNYPI